MYKEDHEGMSKKIYETIDCLKEYEIKTVILGVGSEKPYNNSLKDCLKTTLNESKEKTKKECMPHIPFLGRMAIVELFNDYNPNWGVELKIKWIKITKPTKRLNYIDN